MRSSIVPLLGLCLSMGLNIEICQRWEMGRNLLCKVSSDESCCLGFECWLITVALAWILGVVFLISFSAFAFGDLDRLGCLEFFCF